MKNFTEQFDALSREEKTVFDAVIRHRGITRAAASELLSVNKNRMGTLADGLIRKGFLEEIRPTRRKNSGCGGIGLGAVPGAFYVLAGYFSQEEPSLILANAAGESVERIELLNEEARNTPRFLAEIRQKTTMLLGKIPEESVLGIAIGLPGIVNYDTGDVMTSQPFPNTEDLNIKRIFRENFGLDCMLIDSAHLVAVNEKLYGAAKDVENFIYLSEGLGLGIFANGQLIRGHQGDAGEMGYMKICDNSTIGPDGRTGLLVDKALFRIAGEKILQMIRSGGRVAIDREWSDDDYIHPLTIVHSIKRGDKFVSQVLSELFGYIGDALVNAAYLLNPEVIFLPDWAAECPKQTLDVVRGKLSGYGQSRWNLRVRVEAAGAPQKLIPLAGAKLFTDRFLERHADLRPYKPLCFEIQDKKKTNTRRMES